MKKKMNSACKALSMLVLSAMIVTPQSLFAAKAPDVLEAAVLNDNGTVGAYSDNNTFAWRADGEPSRFVVRKKKADAAGVETTETIRALAVRAGTALDNCSRRTTVVFGGGDVAVPGGVGFYGLAANELYATVQAVAGFTAPERALFFALLKPKLVTFLATAQKFSCAPAVVGACLVSDYAGAVPNAPSAPNAVGVVDVLGNVLVGKDLAGCWAGRSGKTPLGQLLEPWQYITALVRGDAADVGPLTFLWPSNAAAAGGGYDLQIGVGATRASAGLIAGAAGAPVNLKTLGGAPVALQALGGGVPFGVGPLNAHAIAGGGRTLINDTPLWANADKFTDATSTYANAAAALFATPIGFFAGAETPDYTGGHDRQLDGDMDSATAILNAFRFVVAFCLDSFFQLMPDPAGLDAHYQSWLFAKKALANAEPGVKATPKASKDAAPPVSASFETVLDADTNAKTERLVLRMVPTPNCGTFNVTFTVKGVTCQAQFTAAATKEKTVVRSLGSFEAAPLAPGEALTADAKTEIKDNGAKIACVGRGDAAVPYTLTLKKGTKIKGDPESLSVETSVDQLKSAVPGSKKEFQVTVVQLGTDAENAAVSFATADLGYDGKTPIHAYYFEDDDEREAFAQQLQKRQTNTAVIAAEDPVVPKEAVLTPKDGNVTIPAGSGGSVLLTKDPIVLPSTETNAEVVAANPAADSTTSGATPAKTADPAIVGDLGPEVVLPEVPLGDEPITGAPVAVTTVPNPNAAAGTNTGSGETKGDTEKTLKAVGGSTNAGASSLPAGGFDSSRFAALSLALLGSAFLVVSRKKRS
ncbi:MAG: hypothetical protein LBJ83_00800 [Oscillospiraceae bacterium]|nr:hypothetical protein [Oscillospiraceae bacterium]